MKEIFHIELRSRIDITIVCLAGLLLPNDRNLSHAQHFALLALLSTLEKYSHIGFTFNFCDIAPRLTTAATCNITLANANCSTQIVYRMTVDVRQTPHGPHGSQGKPIPSSSDNSAPWGRGGICGSQRLFIAADCSNRTKPVAHGCHAPWMAALMACHGRRPGFTACRQ